ncbi:TPA: hypothetical protein PXS16_001717 [Yersinia enterocolitica]|nr:hypothetical protein [Yersinia enterocolitica]
MATLDAFLPTVRKHISGPLDIMMKQWGSVVPFLAQLQIVRGLARTTKCLKAH